MKLQEIARNYFQTISLRVVYDFLLLIANQKLFIFQRNDKLYGTSIKGSSVYESYLKVKKLLVSIRTGLGE